MKTKIDIIKSELSLIKYMILGYLSVKLGLWLYPFVVYILS